VEVRYPIAAIGCRSQAEIGAVIGVDVLTISLLLRWVGVLLLAGSQLVGPDQP